MADGTLLSRTRAMQRVEVFAIEETGSDFVRLRNDSGDVRVNFADEESFTKEESAMFFRGLRGKPAAIPIDGPFFIAVDLWRDFTGELKVVPFTFGIASVEKQSHTATV